MTAQSSPHNIQIKTHRNKRSEEIPTLTAATEFFLDELLKRCTIEYKLNVLIELKSGVLLADDGSETVGLAHQEDIKGETWYRVALSTDAPFLEMLSTLAHETIHVTQFATGRLRTTDENWIWDGKEYGPDPYIGKEIDNQLPWEYDAYSKEVELTKKFVKKFYSVW